MAKKRSEACIAEHVKGRQVCSPNGAFNLVCFLVLFWEGNGGIREWFVVCVCGFASVSFFFCFFLSLCLF